MKRVIALILLLIIQATSSFADSVVIKKGHYELKGFILDNFFERIVISTFKGEEIIKKDDIENIEFDDKDRGFVFEAQNLLEQEGLSDDILDKAGDMFQEALRINSNNKDAEMGHRRVIDEKLKLKATSVGFLGMTIAGEGDRIKVVEVVPRSPAGMAGVKVGDILYSIWDKKIKYDEVASIIRLLFGPPESSLSFAIEREITVGYNTKASASLEKVLVLTDKGIFPKSNEIEGASPSDRVVSICGNNTRYFTKEYLSWLSKDFKNKNVIITIRQVFDLKRGFFKLEND